MASIAFVCDDITRYITQLIALEILDFPSEASCFAL